jgi:hypothetical protein
MKYLDKTFMKSIISANYSMQNDNYFIFKRFWIKEYSHFKKAYQEKEWFWLIFYIISRLILVLIASVTILGALIQGLTGLGILKENIYEPKRQLVYEMIGQSTKDANNIFITNFILHLYDPRGNLEPFKYFYPDGCESPILIDSGMEQKEGINYAVNNYTVRCKTDKQIVENYELFKLKN